MNKWIKKARSLSVLLIMLITLTACNTQGEVIVNQDNDNENYGLQPVGNYLTQEECMYTNEGVKQNIEKTFASKDGLCTILVYPDYYDVTLDYERGSALKCANPETITRKFRRNHA